MLISRTTGSASVVPELVYADVEEAVDWLCETFGFTELWRAGGHRARLAFGNGVLIVADADAGYGRAVPDRDGLRSYAVEFRGDHQGHRDTQIAIAEERGSTPPDARPGYDFAPLTSGDAVLRQAVAAAARSAASSGRRCLRMAATVCRGPGPGCDPPVK